MRVGRSASGGQPRRVRDVAAVKQMSKKGRGVGGGGDGGQEKGKEPQQCHVLCVHWGPATLNLALLSTDAYNPTQDSAFGYKVNVCCIS